MGILEEKRAWRCILRKHRRELENRPEKNRRIEEAFFGLPQYREAQKLLLYLSTPEEVETWGVFEQALSDGKEVYAPYCPGNNGDMVFYSITSREGLVPGAFGILEPRPEEQTALKDTQGALCVVPGLAFDREGRRLGYGKGYYDRFLADKNIAAVGFCYEELVFPKLPADWYDQRVSLLVTENTVLHFQAEGSFGKEGSYE